MKNTQDYGEQFQKLTSQRLHSGSKRGMRAGTKIASKGLKRGLKAGRRATRSLGRTARRSVRTSAATSSFFISAGPVGWIILAIVLIILIVLLFFFMINAALFLYESGGRVSYQDENSTNLTYDTGSYNASVDDLSAVNCATRSYYDIMSNYTVLQPLTDDNDAVQLDENGNIIYISIFDKRAKRDAFNRDANMKLDYNIVYSLDKAFFGDTLSYPESFLKPVAHTSDFKLASILDDNGYINKNLSSLNKIKNTNVTSTSDYGISTLCTYKTVTSKSTLTGSYVGELWIDNETGEEVVVDTAPETFSYTISQSDSTVLDYSVSMNRAVHYQYNESSTLQPCENGKATSETANSKYILLENNRKAPNPNDTESVYYEAYHKYDENVPHKKFSSEDEILAFLKKNTAYTTKMVNGKPEKHESTPEERSWTVYRIRSSNSGIRTTGITQGPDEVEEYDNTYLYQYASEFESFIPYSLNRDPELLTQIHSKGEIEEYYKAIKNDSTDFNLNTGVLNINNNYADSTLNGNAGAVPDTVLQWTDWVMDRCREYSDDQVDMTLYADSILATIWQESTGRESVKGYHTGRAGDIMQCEESGYFTDDYPASWSRSQASVDAGVRYFKDSLLSWSKKNGGLIAPDDIGNMQVVAKGYNAGFEGYHSFMIKSGAYGYTKETEKSYGIGHYPYGEEWGLKYLSCMGMTTANYTGSSGSDYTLKDDDSKLFSDYFHAGESRTGKYRHYSKCLGESDVDDMLHLANCYTYGFRWDDERRQYKHDDLLAMDLTIQARTSQSDTSGGNAIANGEFVFYFQGSDYNGVQEPWASHPYKYAAGGSSPMSMSGCGPTSLAMIIATLCDKSVTPDQIADISSSYHVGGGTSTGAMTTGLASRYGYKCVVIDSDSPTAQSQVENCLQTGGLVLWSAGNPSPFTTAGHCMVIRGTDGNGHWYIADPNGGHYAGCKLGSSYGINENYNDYAFPTEMITNYWHNDISLIWGPDSDIQ